jgi:hypothetical protein
MTSARADKRRLRDPAVAQRVARPRLVRRPERRERTSSAVAIGRTDPSLPGVHGRACLRLGRIGRGVRAIARPAAELPLPAERRVALCIPRNTAGPAPSHPAATSNCCSTRFDRNRFARGGSERAEAAVSAVVEVRVGMEEVVDDPRSVGGGDAADVAGPDHGTRPGVPSPAEPDLPGPVLVREDGPIARRPPADRHATSPRCPSVFRFQSLRRFDPTSVTVLRDLRASHTWDSPRIAVTVPSELRRLERYLEKRPRPK